MIFIEGDRKKREGRNDAGGHGNTEICNDAEGRNDAKDLNESEDRIDMASPPVDRMSPISANNTLTIEQLKQHTKMENRVTILPPIAPTPSDFHLSREQTKSSYNKELEDKLNELEWYQQQLYDLLGPEAQEFLQPKMISKKIPRRAASRRAKMRQIGGLLLYELVKCYYCFCCYCYCYY